MQKRMLGTKERGYNGVTTDNWWDDVDHKWFHTSSQDVEPMLRQAKAERNHFSVSKNSDNKYGTGTKVAMIPNIVIDQLMRDGVWQDRDRMKKWLNDSKNSEFRTNKMWV